MRHQHHDHKARTAHQHGTSPDRPRRFSARLRQWRAALCLSTLLAGTAQAGIVTLDTASFAGTSARIEINLFDGDGVAGNSTASAFGQLITDFGQILHDFTAGGLLTFHLDFHAGAQDTLVLSLLDAGTNFSLVDTDLDALEAPVPYEDAALVCELQSGHCTVATQSDPALGVAFVPEPATLALLGALPLMFWRRRTALNPAAR